MSKAKTASKNSPSNRGSKILYYYQDKEVVPAKFCDFYLGQDYTCLQYKASGDVVIDQTNNLPLRWDSKILTKKV